MAQREGAGVDHPPERSLSVASTFERDSSASILEVVTSLPTPGQWAADRVGWHKWAIVSDEYRHIALVENDLEQEHVQANAMLIAASAQLLAALKAVDTYLIAHAMNKAKDLGYTATWQQVELLLGVSDMHAEVRQAIAAAEGER